MRTVCLASLLAIVFHLSLGSAQTAPQSTPDRDQWRERLAKAEEAQAAALCFEVFRSRGEMPDRCAPFITKVK